MTTINPFDPRTVLLAKHAQHVVLIHFPIALFITGVALDLFSRGKPGSPVAAAAYLNLSIAAATVLPTILTGLLAWHFALDGQRLKGILLIHVIAACTAASLVIASWWVHWRTRKSLRTLPAYSMLVELLGVALIGLTAHLGGFITGVNS